MAILKKKLKYTMQQEYIALIVSTLHESVLEMLKRFCEISSHFAWTLKVLIFCKVFTKVDIKVNVYLQSF